MPMQDGTHMGKHFAKQALALCAIPSTESLTGPVNKVISWLLKMNFVTTILLGLILLRITLTGVLVVTKEIVVNDFWLVLNGGWASCKYRAR